MSSLIDNPQFQKHTSLIHEIVKNEDIFNPEFLRKFREKRKQELKENLEKCKNSRLNQYYELIDSGNYYFTPSQKQEFLDNDDFDIEVCSMHNVMEQRRREYYEYEQDEYNREYWEEKEREREIQEEEDNFRASKYNNEGYWFKNKFYHWNS